MCRGLCLKAFFACNNERSQDWHSECFTCSLGCIMDSVLRLSLHATMNEVKIGIVNASH
ncbi:hypothetical protein AVEN_33412-1, partial [Araneus ventricosus]